MPTITLTTTNSSTGNADGFSPQGFDDDTAETDFEATAGDDPVLITIKNDSRQIGGFYMRDGTNAWTRLSGDGGKATITLGDSTLKIELAGSESAGGGFATLTLTKVTPKPG